MSFFRFIRLILKVSHYQSVSSQKSLPPYSDYQAVTRENLQGLISSFPNVSLVWVIDGDTVIVRKGWHQIKIRLDAIDCPEDGQEWGEEAKRGLIKCLYRKRIRIEEHGKDIHSRTLATLHVWNEEKECWENVNELMIMRGHAWVMRFFYNHLPQDRKRKLNQLENWAKRKQVGLWRSDNPTPPWKWRKTS